MPDILWRMVTRLNTDSMKDLRTCSMFLVAYAGFLRFYEKINIKLMDVEVCSSHMKIFLERSKTDQFREGAWVVIASTGKVTCPVRMLNRYLSSAGIGDMSSEELFLDPFLFVSRYNRIN